MAGLATLTHRGPDDNNLIELGNTLLGHCRLSIIDLSGGKQPMQDATGNLTITFGGEIYNYRELRAELEKKGSSFRTHSDTEVILEAYRTWGYGCVTKFDGMFAFGIWDNKREELFLARDRFGEKPLYYARVGEEIIFASEIKAILATGLVTSKLDMVSLDNYLALSYVPPWRSIYEGILPLPPAHYAVVKNGIMTKTQYWKLRRKSVPLSFEEAADAVREMMQKSVKSRLVADVEVGTFLSGGIDSSIVTALAQQATAPKKIRTFSAGFEDFINELPYAKEIAERYGTEHTAMDLRVDLKQAFTDVTRYFDEPFADSSNVPTHLLSEFTRTAVTVALSGDGGDELFYGYGHYRSYWRLSLRHRITESIRARFSDHPAYLIKFFRPHERKELWRDPSPIENSWAPYLDLQEAETRLQKMQLVDLQLTLPGDILPKVDRASMMHSLEVRAPFLYHELVELAFNLPDEYKTNRDHGKLVLARAFKDYIPPEFFTRKKQGFGAPIQHWLRKKEMLPLLDTITEPSARLAVLMRPEYIRTIAEKFKAGDNTQARKVWSLFSLEMWLRTHPEIVLK